MSIESVERRSGRSVFKLFVQLLFPMNFRTLRPKGEETLFEQVIPGALTNVKILDMTRSGS